MLHNSNEKLGWVTFREKLREKRASAIINDILPNKRKFVAYLLSQTSRVGLTYLDPKDIGEMTQRKGYYEVLRSFTVTTFGTNRKPVYMRTCQ